MTAWLARLGKWIVGKVADRDSEIRNLRAERDSARQDLRAVVDSQRTLIDTLVAGQATLEKRVSTLEVEVAKCHAERDAHKDTIRITEARVKELEDRLKELGQ